MRTSVLCFSATLLLSHPAIAQINAGDIPTGTSAVSVGIDLQLNTAFTVDSASFDVDCDSMPDIMAVLVRGEPASDAPNSCYLQLLNPMLELCTDLATFNKRPQYYGFGQLLDCTGYFEWQSDSVNVLGDIGGFTAIGPWNMDSAYVAYRNGGQVGWILLSFDLVGGGIGQLVQLQIHQVLQPCSSTSIATHAMAPAVAVFPNPSNGQAIHVESLDALRSIEVLDPTGRFIARYSGTERTIPAPEVAGAYLVRTVHADGGRSITRLIRQ